MACQMNQAVKLPVWKKKDSFLAAFLDNKVVVAHCPTGSGKSTILPALAAMHLHPHAGRVCCTQIRRVTTQSVSRNAKDIWDNFQRITCKLDINTVRNHKSIGMNIRPRCCFSPKE